MRLDIAQQLADYRGVLGWNAVSGKWPAIEIPLFIQEHPIAIRKPKILELATYGTADPISGKDQKVHYIFRGAPDLLTLTISGWIITPKVSNAFSPKDKLGADLNIGNISYGEIILAFIEGHMDISAAGSFNRKDPDYYITPYGQQYNGPVIQTFEMQYTPTMKKQSFNMTLLLEK